MQYLTPYTPYSNVNSINVFVVVVELKRGDINNCTDNIQICTHTNSRRGGGLQKQMK